jgi:putative membrane protein
VGILYVKAFHVIFMVTWFAGVFYLPRLFVYHAMTTDAATSERLKVMER